MDLICIEPIEDLHFRIQVRNHQLSSDYGIADGGTDRGPSPTEMLVGSLGSCIGMTIARYCQTIGCASQGLEVYLTYQLTDSPKRIAAIIVDVELPDGFPEDRIKALSSIIKTCPVHNTLAGQPQIDIEFSKV